MHGRERKDEAYFSMNYKVYFILSEVSYYVKDIVIHSYIIIYMKMLNYVSCNINFQILHIYGKIIKSRVLKYNILMDKIKEIIGNNLESYTFHTLNYLRLR